MNHDLLRGRLDVGIQRVPRQEYRRVHTNKDILDRFQSLYEGLIAHDGFGEMRLEFRILRRGQKEVVIHCGKQYRFVVDYRPSNPLAWEVRRELPHEEQRDPDPRPRHASPASEAAPRPATEKRHRREAIGITERQ